MSDNQTGQVLEAELKRLKRRCWASNCKNKAFLRDWTGWVSCFSHWFEKLSWQEKGNKWFFLKSTRLF